MEITEFYSLCDHYLHFLIDDYGCTTIYSKNVYRDVCHGYVVLYNNSTTAVKLTLEFPEVYLHFFIYKLVDGQLCENPIIISLNSVLNCFEIETLLLIRAPEYKLPQPPSFTGNSVHKYVEEKISGAAKALKCYCDDI